MSIETIGEEDTTISDLIVLSIKDSSIPLNLSREVTDSKANISSTLGPSIWKSFKSKEFTDNLKTWSMIDWVKDSKKGTGLDIGSGLTDWGEEEIFVVLLAVLKSRIIRELAISSAKS